MKKRIIITGYLLRLFTCDPAVAQYAPASQVPATPLPSLHFQLSENKTGNIIFPYAIKSVDRGSGDIIAQVVQGFGNILQLKAGIPQFRQTNVTVITSDGRFYSFLVDYDPDPKVLNISFSPASKPCEAAPALPDDPNEARLDSEAIKALHAGSFLHQATGKEQMRLRLAGIYLKDGLMWFKLALANRSRIDYIPDQTSFTIIDKKQVRRTARQQIVLTPVYNHPGAPVIGKHTGKWVQAFLPLTLPGNKRLKILVTEKADGRDLMMYIRAKKLLRARVLK